MIIFGFGDGEGLAISIALMIATAIMVGPPIVGYFMTQSYVDYDGKLVPASNPPLGWFLLIGYPIILVCICIAIWWYKKQKTNTNAEPLLS
jgi:hypothetical protein